MADRDPIGRGQRDETQEAGEPGVREGYSDCGDDEGCRYQRRAGSTFEKRNLCGPNDMDDERLSEQGFDEPTGLE